MAEAWYCTRNDVKRALQVLSSAASNDRIDRAIDASSEDVEGQMRRVFYPHDTTVYFDWLPHQYDLVWRTWLDKNELCQLPTSVVSAGTNITSMIFARPDDGPPYDSLEIDLSQGGAFAAGATYQRAISVTGTFGYKYKTASLGTITASVNNTTDKQLQISTSLGWDVGSLLIIDNERMLVTKTDLLSTTATLSGNIDAQAKTTTVPVSNGALVQSGEMITIGSERMYVQDVSGNNLVVERGYDGSVLAAHTSADVVYAPRLATVTRAALGTTIASHSNGAAVLGFVYPSLIRQLTIAEAVTNIIQERAGYARSVGTQNGPSIETIGKGLVDLRTRARTAHCRKVLVRTTPRYI